MGCVSGTKTTTGSFGSPVSRRDPGLFHGLIRPVPASSEPKLCTVWQPMKSRMEARFSMFSSGNKSTTHWLGRVSPCAREPRGSSSSPRDAAGSAATRLGSPGSADGLHPDRDGEAHRITASRLRPGISSTLPRHPIDDASASHRPRPGTPSPLPWLPVACAISSFWSSQQ